jgi:hypothetical protein
MKTKISFLVCSKNIDGIPSIAIDKVDEHFYIPTFEITEENVNIDSFICEKFNFLTGGNASYKKNIGDTNIYICGTIVDGDYFSIVFGCYIPRIFEHKNIHWESMSILVEEDFFDEEYKEQIISCFNYFSR